MIMGKELSLYIHVPFCVRKCLYCDFLSFNCKAGEIKSYFNALDAEIAMACNSYRDFTVKSIFFGGGTPSFVDSVHICNTLEHIRENFQVDVNAEISIEVNPASAILDKLMDYRRAGINRISIGAQSLNDGELKEIGRAHNSAMFYETFANARKAGFDNINIDIMSALPDQTMDSYMETLEKVVSLGPEHISAYSLIVEEGTPFYDMDLNLPDEDTDRQMYHETRRFLAQNGYHRYEISNYAKGSDGDKTCECYHNKVYWRRGNYLGLGLGASSMTDDSRWKNISDFNMYQSILLDKSSFSDKLHGLRTEYEKLSRSDCMEEFMFLGLRLVEGVSISEFKSLFGRDIYDVYGKIIEKYISEELLEQNGDHIRLTETGMDVSNTVMADFLF